jgi:hypothetical protein
LRPSVSSSSRRSVSPPLRRVPSAPALSSPSPVDGFELRRSPSQVSLTAAPSALPAWFPPGFDLEKATASVRDYLIGLGAKPESFTPGAAKRIVFADADQTLVQTATPVYVRHKETGELLKHPVTGRLVLLGIGPTRSQGGELKALQAAHPEVPWSDYAMDYKEMGAITEILRTPEIAVGMNYLRQAEADPQARAFIITARSNNDAIDGFKEYLAQRDLKIDGVLTVNTARTAEVMGFEMGLDTPAKKALVMAALIKAYGGIPSAHFLDDTDENLHGSMQLLPRLLPETSFCFSDVVHTGGGEYERVVAGRSAYPGQLVDAKFQPIDDGKVTEYRSRDAHFALDPVLQPKVG